MKIKEAIKILDDGQWWEYLDEWYIDANREYDRLIEAVGIAVEALKEKQKLSSMYCLDISLTDIDIEEMRAKLKEGKILLCEEKNEPLTIDELRKMKGKPVWVQPPEHTEYGTWGIVRGAGEFNGEKMLFIDSDFTCHDYGRTWLAYRHELKEE